MRARVVALSLSLTSLLGCTADAAPSGACEVVPWVDAEAPYAISIRASGAVVWDASAPGPDPIVSSGMLRAAEGDAVTTLRFDTDAGELVVEIGLARSRLGVLPIGEPLEVTLGSGLVLTNAEGRIETAVISLRGRSEAVAANVTFRQSYAECARAFPEAGCSRVIATPLVDVVTGASILRLPPDGVWRIPNDVDPTVEIEIVRSVRAHEEGDVTELAGMLCAEMPAREIAAIIRHLR